MTDAKRQLLQRLADAGKPTTLSADELVLAELLEADGLLFLIKNTPDAIITPRGRHELAGIEFDGKPGKKPFGFTQ
jgi:hypothetical protein